MKNLTTDVKIRISRETRKALLDMGQKGESYDAVIRRLMRGKEIAEKYIYCPDDWGKYLEDLEAEG